MDINTAKVIFLLAIVTLPHAPSQHAALGRTQTVSQLSDNFEQPWTFNYSVNPGGANGISSNGQWSGLLRHAPENLNFVATPANGPTGSSTALAMSTIDNNDDPFSTQEDFGHIPYNSAASAYSPGYLSTAVRPLVTTHLFAPQASAFDLDRGYDLGLRTAGTGVGFPGAGNEVYPSIFLDYNRASGGINVYARSPNGSRHSDFLVQTISPGQWYTLGIGYETGNFVNYYLSSGAVDLSPGDQIFSTSSVAGAPAISELRYDFYSMTSPTDKSAPNETWIVDDHRVQIVPEPSTSVLLGILGSICLGRRRRSW